MNPSARRRGKAARGRGGGGHPHPHSSLTHQPAAGFRRAWMRPDRTNWAFDTLLLVLAGDEGRRGGRGPAPDQQGPRPHTLQAREGTWNAGPRKTLRGLILRSGAKSTTFRHNLISFSINTKCKPCPSVSVLPIAISASLSVGSRAGGMCGRVFLNTELQSICPGEGRGGAGAGWAPSPISLYYNELIRLYLSHFLELTEC